jgi:HSP20 family protein
MAHLRDTFFLPVERAFDRFFDEFWGAPKVTGYMKSNLHYPKMDVGIKGDEFVMTAAVPGVSQEEIKVEVLPDKIVRVSGEMSEEFRSDDSELFVKELCKRKFAREWALPSEVEDENPIATLKNGILTLRWKMTNKKKLPETKVIPILGE